MCYRVKGIKAYQIWQVSKLRNDMSQAAFVVFYMKLKKYIMIRKTSKIKKNNEKCDLKILFVVL